MVDVEADKAKVDAEMADVEAGKGNKEADKVCSQYKIQKINVICFLCCI